MAKFLHLTKVCLFMFAQGFALESAKDSTRCVCEYSLIEKVVTLQTENAKLAGRITTLEQRRNDRQTAVATYIRLSGPTPFSGSMRVMYDLKMSNKGNGYNFELRQFIAPVSGIYLIHVTACLKSGGQWIDLNVIEDDKVIGRVFAGDNAYHACGSELLSVHLDSRANVWVERTAGISTWLNDDHGWNSFKVTLIQVD